MREYTSQLRWIDAQRERMTGLLIEWARINTGSRNLAGLERCSAAVMREMERLGGRMSLITLRPQQIVGGDGQLQDQPLGKVIRIVKRESSPSRVLLGIHLDTVYSADDPFQTTTLLGDGRLQGPGVADAKGGLVVMLTALEAFERSPEAGRIGWEMLINPDEELGSPGSAKVWAEAAARNHVGLLFEPAQEDGALVGARKGSGNFTAVVTGRAAHAGRNPEAGRNAIHALAELISRISRIGEELPGATVNVGQVEGGTGVNVVPDRAMCRFNVRVISAEQQRIVASQVSRIAGEINERDGISVQVTGGFTAPPKPLDEGTLRILEQVAECGRELGIPIHWRDSGGVSDGNRLAAAGLPNVDSLGVRGGAIHSPGEYVWLDSLTERAKLTALLLTKLAG